MGKLVISQRYSDEPHQNYQTRWSWANLSRAILPDQALPSQTLSGQILPKQMYRQDIQGERLSPLEHEKKQQIVGVQTTLAAYAGVVIFSNAIITPAEKGFCRWPNNL